MPVTSWSTTADVKDRSVVVRASLEPPKTFTSSTVPTTATPTPSTSLAHPARWSVLASLTPSVCGWMAEGGISVTFVHPPRPTRSGRLRADPGGENAAQDSVQPSILGTVLTTQMKIAKVTTCTPVHHRQRLLMMRSSAVSSQRTKAMPTAANANLARWTSRREERHAIGEQRAAITTYWKRPRKATGMPRSRDGQDDVTNSQLKAPPTVQTSAWGSKWVIE